MKIRGVWAELFHADRQTDRRTDMTKLIVLFRNFAKTLKINLKKFVKLCKFCGCSLPAVNCTHHVNKYTFCSRSNDVENDKNQSNKNTQLDATINRKIYCFVLANRPRLRTLPPPHSYENQRLQRQFDGLLTMGIVMPETCWAVSVRQSNKFYDCLSHLVGCFIWVTEDARNHKP